MKTITREFDFTSKNQWQWPESDTKLLQVIGQVEDINTIIPFVKRRGVCIQAGGACGIWPYRFSQLFERVYTFEPSGKNRECLKANIEGIENITVSGCALSFGSQSGAMLEHPSEVGNSGALYFEQGDGDVKTITIDSLDLKECDLIQLDIEGFEFSALTGALETIKRCSPVIVIEEKRLPQFSLDSHKAAREFLELSGYHEAGRINKDVIFKC